MTSGILSRGQLGRRRMLAAAGAALLVGAVDGCSVGGFTVKRRTPAAGALQLAPLRAATDRITQITVCTRPFRAQAPRLEVERIAQKIIVHNYGHGGSGWALARGRRMVAVLGIEEHRGEKGEGRRRTRDRRDRLRCPGTHLRLAPAALRRT